MATSPTVDTFLDHTDFVYSRMVGIAWNANRLLQPTVLTADAGNALLGCVQNKRPEAPIVLNCKGISTIEDHALSAFKEYLKQTGRQAIILIPSSQDQLGKEVDSELGEVFSQKHRIDTTHAHIYGKQDVTSGQVAAVIEGAKKLEQSFVTKVISESYRAFDKPERLESTPLIASGVLNARSLISDPRKFIWISLLLADAFQAVVNEAKPRTVRILAVSLRGGPFAAAVRVLSDTLSPTLEIVDHIGPRHEVLEDQRFVCDFTGGEYVLVGDFVIGGTEIKIARAYALAKGAKLNCAVAIGSFLDPSAYSQTVTLRSLVQLPEVVPELKYEFK